MNIDAVLYYMEVYGYIIIFVSLFFGIVGIPAPEESLLFLIGVLITQHQLSFGMSLLSAFLGAFAGSLTAYACGKYIGAPFINKYGKYIGMTIERWRKVQTAYAKNVNKAILFGFFIVGIRQISPYIAGMTKVVIPKFLFLSLFGSLFWTVPYIAVGYYVGSAFDINPEYVPYLGLVFMIAFLLYIFFQFLKKRLY